MITVKSIHTLEDVRTFARQLLLARIAFHPDTPFEDYITKDGTPCFTPAECEMYNGLLYMCFAVCDKCGVDIYEIMDITDLPYTLPEITVQFHEFLFADNQNTAAMIFQVVKEFLADNNFAITKIEN